MAVFLARPNANAGATNNWTVNGGVAVWDALNDAVTAPTAPPVGSDFISTTTTGNVAEVALDDVSLVAGRTINSIIARVYCATSGVRRTLTIDLRYNVGGTGADTSLGTTVISQNTGANWQTVTANTNSLTDDELSSLRLRFTATVSSSTSTGTATVYAAYTDVTYTANVNLTASADDAVSGYDTADARSLFVRSGTDSAPAADGGDASVLGGEIQTTTVGAVAEVALEDYGLPAGSDASSVTAIVRASTGAGIAIDVQLRTASTVLASGTIPAGSAEARFEFTYNGDPLTQSDVDDLRLRFTTTGTGGGLARVAAAYADVAAVGAPPTSFSVSGSDTAAASDTGTRSALSFSRDGSDAVTGSDAAARGATLRTRTGTDTAPAADSASPRITRVRTTTDTAPAVDALSRYFSTQRDGSDTAPAADSASRGPQSFSRTTLELLTPADDAATRVSSTSAIAADLAPATDSASKGASLYYGVTADTAPAADAANRSALSFTRGGVDTAPASDSTTRNTVEFRRSTGDNASASDAASRTTLDFRRATGDNAPATDAAIGTRTAALRTRTASDAAPANDAAIRGALAIVRFTADLAPATDFVIGERGGYAPQTRWPVTIVVDGYRGIAVPDDDYSDAEVDVPVMAARGLLGHATATVNVAGGNLALTSGGGSAEQQPGGGTVLVLSGTGAAEPLVTSQVGHADAPTPNSTADGPDGSSSADTSADGQATADPAPGGGATDTDDYVGEATI